MTKSLLLVLLVISFVFHENSEAKSIAAIYGDFMKTVEKLCENKFKKEKALSRACLDSVRTGIEKDCGNKPWEDCFFNDNGDYMTAGSSNWTKVQKLLDKAMGRK